MSRPLISHSIDQLTAEFERAKSINDRVALETLATELGVRKTPRARALREDLQKILERDLKPSVESDPPRKTPDRHPRPPHRLNPSSREKTSLKPTQEQEVAIEYFRGGGSQKINAFAGTGKTSTLVMLAKDSHLQGQCIAFNRSIVADAKEKFPATVNCSTTHGLAFRAMASRFENSSDKLTGKINANQLSELLGLTKWRADEHHVLSARAQGFLILDTIRRFAQSADKEPTALHVPRHGSMRSASASTISAVDEFVVRGAKYVWHRMQNGSDPIPLGHDGYLKLWALSEPIIATDFILLDEAQDTNPVVLELLQKQPAQMIYVGDRHQQIYEWRGAVNAMELIETRNSCSLTTSFRFGNAIADAATEVLRLLGERQSLNGNPRLDSRIGSNSAQTVLARTNANTITAVIEALNDGLRPHLVGGVAELMAMLRGVQELKEGQPTSVPEFIGFTNWDEVLEFVRSGEGDHLQTFVNLVEARGERQLMWALNRTVDEEKSDLIISTAHKAKGREWESVRLMDDFLKSVGNSKNNKNGDDQLKDYAAELRLFYVALTRAKHTIEVPSSLLSLIGAASSAKNPNCHNDASARRTQSTSETSASSTWQAPKDWESPRSASPKSVPYGLQTPNPAITARPLKPPEKVCLHNVDRPSQAPVPVSISSTNSQAPRRNGFLRWLFGK